MTISEPKPTYIAGTQIADPAFAPARAMYAAPPADSLGALASVGNLSPSLARILRPQAAYRWLLPYLAAITPQYVEGILRGALAGNHVQAWELFDLMMDTDPEIRACVGEYVDGVKMKKIIIEPYHDEDEEPTPNAIRNQKIVSAALRNMRPDPQNDENSLRGMVGDVVFARFHGQSIQELDWFDTFGDGSANRLLVQGVGNILAPRAAFWVHPVCYAWDMSGRLGLRVALQNEIQEVSKTARNQKPGQRAGNSAMTDAPVWNWISSQPMPSSVMNFPPNKFLISVFKGKAGTALSGCDLRPLAWWWIASNFCGDWLLNYAQIFGVPLRKATYALGTPDEVRQTAENLLQAAGSAPWTLMPEGVNIKIVSAGSGGGAESPQAFLFHFADEQKRKVILRQTMVGSGRGAASGSKGGMTAESKVKDACTQGGAEFACDILREQYARILLKVNAGSDAELPFIRMMEVDEGNLEDMQRDQIGAQLISLGENYFRKKYNYPKPGPGEEIAGQSGPSAQPDGPPTDPVLQRQISYAKWKSDFADAKAKGGGGAAGAGAKGPPPGGGSAGGANAQPEDAELDASASLEAAYSGKPVSAAAGKTLGEAILDDLEPVRNDLAAIEKIEDPELFRKKIAEYIADNGPLVKRLADINAYPKSAKVIQETNVEEMAKALAAKPKALAKLQAGDVAALEAFNPDEPRDATAKWTEEGSTGTAKSGILKGPNDRSSTETATDPSQSPGTSAHYVGRGQETADSGEASRKEWYQRVRDEESKLHDWAEQNGKLGGKLPPEDDRGGEHIVHFDPKTQRYFKATYQNLGGDNAGYGIHVGSNESGSTPSEYLDRWDQDNKLFDDQVRVERVVKLPVTAAGPKYSIVISQPIVKGVPAPEKDIDEMMAGKGFEKIGHGAYYQESSHTLVSDMKGAEHDSPNVLKTADGRIHPIDPIVQRADSGLVRAWLSSPKGPKR